MSPALLERYLAAARVISRSVVGSPPPGAAASIYRVSPELQQHDRGDRLPLGTRGGTLIRHLFPVDAEYEIKVELTGGGAAADPLEIAIDGVQVHLVPPGTRGEPELRVPVTAGPHEISVTFFRRPPHLVEQVREPFQNPAAPSNTGGPAGRVPGVASVTIVGPHAVAGAGGPSASSGSTRAQSRVEGDGSLQPSRDEKKRADAERRRKSRADEARRARIEGLKARIAVTEQAIRDLEEAMAAPGFYDDRTAAQPLIDRHQSLMWEVGTLMHQWEELHAASGQTARADV